MTGLTDIFSTREIALFIWALVFVGLFSIKKEFRKSIVGLIGTFFSKHIIRYFALMVVYVLLTIYLLSHIGLWDSSLTKDTVFWFFTVALVTFFTANKARDFGFFKEIIRDSIKWIIIIEFLINFYTFSLGTELIFVPIMIFITVIQAYSATDRKHELVEKFFTKIIIVIGLAFFVYVAYETITQYQKTFTIQNLKSLLHPIIMTVLFLPFAYLLALFMIYELLFVRVDFLTRDKQTGKRLKRQIMWTANFNINRLNRISRNLNIFDFSATDIKGFVEKIAE